MAFSLVLPASRGVGFAMARQLLKTTELPVVATSRSNIDETKSKILDGLDVDSSRLSMLKVDVTDEAGLAAASKELRSKFDDASVRLAFIMPGILPITEKSPDDIDLEKSLETYRVNTLGPLLAMKYFHSFLPSKQDKAFESTKGLPDFSIWANMSARIGSVSDNKLGGWFTARSSKAAINQINKSFDNYLKGKAGERAIAIGLHPGTVKTEFSKAFWSSNKNMVSPEEAAENLGKVLAEMKVDMRGRCWDAQGKEILP